MTPRTQTYPDPRAVVLPIGYTAWLTDCVPEPGCKQCASAWADRRGALAAFNIPAAIKASTAVRDHASGAHGGRADRV